MIKPIAIFYADKLEDLPADSDGNFLLINNAADELRRLHALNSDLLDAIIAARKLWGDYLPAGNSNAMKAMKLVDAAIAKATGQNAQA